MGRPYQSFMSSSRLYLFMFYFLSFVNIWRSFNGLLYKGVSAAGLYFVLDEIKKKNNISIGINSVVHYRGVWYARGLSSQHPTGDGGLQGKCLKYTDFKIHLNGFQPLSTVILA